MINNIDLSLLEEIEPSRGFKKIPILSLSKRTLNVRANMQFIDLFYLKNKKFTNIKAIRGDNCIVVANSFSEEEKEKSFPLIWYKDDKKDRYSFTFSIRDILFKFNIKKENIDGDKTLKLDPDIQKSNEDTYFIFKIPIKN